MKRERDEDLMDAVRVQLREAWIHSKSNPELARQLERVAAQTLARYLYRVSKRERINFAPIVRANRSLSLN